jgi:hypothetical protein
MFEKLFDRGPTKDNSVYCRIRKKQRGFLLRSEDVLQLLIFFVLSLCKSPLASEKKGEFS